MIAISTITYDLDGSRVFRDHAEPCLSQTNRRVSRTATLDCDVSIYDGGQCDGDRDITIEVTDPSEDDVAFCEYIVRYYGQVHVSCSDGVFLAVPYSFKRTDEKMTFTLYIKERIS